MNQPDPAFEALLEHVKTSRGFDFTGYKRSSLMRRVDRRMAQIGVASYVDYLDRLELHGDEFTSLFNTVLINVTGFFRDAEAWQHLSQEVLPALLARKPVSQPLRVWSAGCASGEEAYTLAIVLAELMGLAEFRDRVKIYATDVDEEALAHARQAAYTEREVRGIPPELLERYFDQTGGRFVFRKDLRRSVIFGRNDLVQDAPISRIDLLVCRNTLMYFNAETQARILTRFHFALASAGMLFLGKAEMLLGHGTLFAPVDLKRRMFRKASRELPPAGTLLGELGQHRSMAEPDGLDMLRNEALLAAPMAQVVITADGVLALANRKAEQLFGVSAHDVGRPFHDLEISYRPLELRRHIEQAQSERRPVRVTDVALNRGGKSIRLEVQVSPLVDGANEVVGTTAAFHDVTDYRRLQDELEQANRQLETAYEELQSTNEELETMNEELQSTNDELQTINDELQDRTGELDSANGFLETILTSLRAGVVVLSTGLHVQVWNRQAQELWGLRPEEAVGQHFLNLDIGLPTDRLRSLIRRTLADEDGSQEAIVDAVNRRGRTIEVRVLGSALRAITGEVAGIILTMEGAENSAERSPAAPDSGVG